MPFEVPFIRPVFPSAEAIASDVADIVGANWYTNFGPKEQEFREALIGYLGEGVEVATFCNATIALVGALSVVLDSSPKGGGILIPSFTFAAGPLAIQSVGREPVFVDIDERTLQPSLESAMRASRNFSGRIDAIVFCNSFGIGAEGVDDWERFAAELGVPLVIDSAAGFGSKYPDGSKVGMRGDCEVFSFHATKPFAIGEGGAVVARDSNLISAVRSFSNFGFGEGGAVRPGLNGKLQEINAAIGIRQLTTLDSVVAERRMILERYRSIFEPVKGAALIPHADKSSVCFCSVVFGSESVREEFRAELVASGIEARVYYAPPVHLQPQFSNVAKVVDLGVTEAVSRQILALPVFQGMLESTFATVQSVVQDHLERNHS